MKRSPIAALTLLTCAVLAAGCGARSVAATPVALSRTAPSVACAATVRAQLVTVARRIYAQAAGGRNATAARRRIVRSTALARAVAAADPAATRAALQPLLKHQITRIEIRHGVRLLARYGTTPAYGPVRGVLELQGRAVGRYVLAVSRDADFAGLVHELTGARATFRSGTVTGAAPALPATAFPRGHATIALAPPRLPDGLCGPTPADTRAATVGWVARNLLEAETSGAGARRAVRHAEKDPAFRAAVAAADPAAVRAAIVGFFDDKHFHVVRGRVWNAQGLVDDVGGPHVLSPAAGTITSAGGTVLGRFLLSIQDDTGYIKLLHRFTGADVTLSTAQGTVPGSNVDPGPAFAPGLRRITYHHRRWLAFGLTGTAFPAGPLNISLLMHGA
jgi:hypothetical protein